MKNDTNNEFKREITFRVLLHQIMEIMKIQVAALKLLPDNETANLQKQETAQLANELLPVYTLASSIHKHGLPKSLIFINESGIAIDLLDAKELDQEAAFDELLDNMVNDKKNGHD